MPRRLDHVASNVRDFHRSAASYARVFNLTPPEWRPDAGARDWQHLRLQHGSLALGEAEFRRAAEVIAAESAIEGPTEDLGGRSLYFRDPDDNVIKHRCAWDPARVEQHHATFPTGVVSSVDARSYNHRSRRQAPVIT